MNTNLTHRGQEKHKQQKGRGIHTRVSIIKLALGDSGPAVHWRLDDLRGCDLHPAASRPSIALHCGSGGPDSGHGKEILTIRKERGNLLLSLSGPTRHPSSGSLRRGFQKRLPRSPRSAPPQSRSAQPPQLLVSRKFETFSRLAGSSCQGFRKILLKNSACAGRGLVRSHPYLQVPGVVARPGLPGTSGSVQAPQSGPDDATLASVGRCAVPLCPPGHWPSPPAPELQ